MGGKLHLQDCICGQLLLPLVQDEPVLLVVRLHPVVLKQVSHQNMDQPVSSPPSQPALALRETALQAPMIALNGSIGVLI